MVERAPSVISGKLDSRFLSCLFELSKERAFKLEVRYRQQMQGVPRFLLRALPECAGGTCDVSLPGSASADRSDDNCFWSLHGCEPRSKAVVSSDGLTIGDIQPDSSDSIAVREQSPRQSCSAQHISCALQVSALLESRLGNISLECKEPCWCCLRSSCAATHLWGCRAETSGQQPAIQSAVLQTVGHCSRQPCARSHTIAPWDPVCVCIFGKQIVLSVQMPPLLPWLAEWGSRQDTTIYTTSSVHCSGTTFYQALVNLK